MMFKRVIYSTAASSSSSQFGTGLNLQASDSFNECHASHKGKHIVFISCCVCVYFYRSWSFLCLGGLLLPPPPA